MSQLLGYEGNELVGKQRQSLFEQRQLDKPDFASVWKGVLRGERSTLNSKLITRSGEPVWVHSNCVPIRDRVGKIISFVEFIVDISSETQHAFSAQGQLDAIDRLMAVIEFEVDGTIVKANKNFLGATGYRLEEIQGQHHRIFMSPEERDTPEYRDFWARLRGGEFIIGEFKRIRKNGEILYIQANYHAMSDEDGKVVKVIKLATDVTEQVKMRNESRETGLAVASGTSQLTMAASEISRSVSHTAGLAETAESLAAKTSESVNQLHESSKLIERVVTVIHELADQTNLLALNATIESARAGEAGRSFAVVASEVKQLASQTADATKSIEQTVRDIQASVGSVVESTLGITKSVSDVNANMATIATAIEEQSVTMADISERASKLI